MSFFDKLPAELMVQLLRTLDSPLDLRSFLSACPGAFQYFDVHRRHVLQPHLDLVLEGLEDEYTILIAPSITKLRSIQHLLPYLDPDEVHAKVNRIKRLPLLKPAEWQGNLPILCDLFCLIFETNDYIARYLSETSRDTITLTPSMLSEDERYTLKNTFLQFESHRHGLFHNRSSLSRLILFHNNPWNLIEMRSLFSFISAKYHRLVQRVDWHLRATMIRNGKPPTGKSLLLDSDLNSNRVCQFRQRTIHEELRYVAYLCLQGGYALLIHLEKLDIKQLRHYILTTFLWVLLHEPRDEMLGFSLESLYKSRVKLERRS